MSFWFVCSFSFVCLVVRVSFLKFIFDVICSFLLTSVFLPNCLPFDTPVFRYFYLYLRFCMQFSCLPLSRYSSFVMSFVLSFVLSCDLSLLFSLLSHLFFLCCHFGFVCFRVYVFHSFVQYVFLSFVLSFVLSFFISFVLSFFLSLFRSFFLSFFLSFLLSLYMYIYVPGSPCKIPFWRLSLSLSLSLVARTDEIIVLALPSKFLLSFGWHGLAV